MKHSLPVLLLITASCALSLLLNAQSNQPVPAKTIVLPPPNWREIQKHALSALISTNTPGKYPLKPAWSGVEQLTLRTGLFKHDIYKRDQTNQSFHFNTLMISTNQGPNFGRHIWEQGQDREVSGSVCAYRDSLPTDAELLVMHDDLSVSNLFHLNPFAHHETNGSSFGMHLFTLGPYNTIRTLRVIFYKGPEDATIDSVVAMRGIFRQETAAPK